MYRIKRKADGSIERYKVCLVAKGFYQEHGLDYDETFSLIVKPTFIRTIFSIIVSNRWPIWKLHANNTFLNNFLDKDVFMVEPPASQITLIHIMFVIFIGLCMGLNNLQEFGTLAYLSFSFKTGL